MNRSEQNMESLLDAAIAEVQNDPIDERAVEETSRRVWQRIMAQAEQEEPAPVMRHVEQIRSCEDFQALMPDYRAGKLNPARRLLLEDHTHECVNCRRVLHPETSTRLTPKVMEMPARRRWTPQRWAVAAAVVIGVGFSTMKVVDYFGPAPAGPRATVVAVQGGVFRLDGDNMTPVATGAAFGDRERLRTGAGAHAVVRLLDGSTVELSERAQMSVVANRRDTDVRLERGKIIVQAAKRSSGHLYVFAGDARVAVTGTVFSVNRAIAGSRVSVIEGEVEVRHHGDEKVLRAGDQTSTHGSLGAVPIDEEISWSRNLDQHLAMLKQFADLKAKIEQVRMPQLRYGSRLMDAVPEGATIYIAMPNMGSALADVDRIIKEQASQNPEMQRMLDRQMPRFQEVTRTIVKLSEYLGDEIVFGMQPCSSFCGVFAAEVHRPGLREFITTEAQRLNSAPFRVVEGTEVPAGVNGQLIVLLTGDRLIVGEDPAVVQAAAKRTGAFANTEFGRTVADVYKRGAGILLAVNLHAMAAKEMRDNDMQALAKLGVSDVKYLIAEQRTFDQDAQYSASVNFTPVRRGVVSWLAEPGPAGSLHFVSPDAQFAATALMKNPVQMLEEAMQFANATGSRDIQEFDRALGVDLKNDLAGALGGEFTVAFDGPMLPVPSWKFIVEVNDPAKLQAAIEKIVTAANGQLKQHGASEILLSSDKADRTYHMLKFPSAQMFGELHYAIVDGYMVAAGTRALLERSINDRRGGVSLARSHRFTSLLPRNTGGHFSAMVYQNAGELVKLMAQGADALKDVSPDRAGRVQELADKLAPTLVCAYGSSDRIEVASRASVFDFLAQGVTIPGFAGTPAAKKAYR